MAKTQEELKDEELMEVAGGVGLLDENDDDSSLGLDEDETLEGNFLGARRSPAKDWVTSEQKKREHYEKPSTKRKKKPEAARKRRLK